MNFKHETIDGKSESTWWQRRSMLEKRLLILSLVGLLIIIFLVTALNLGNTPSCSTKECIQLSNSLLNSMDLNVTPCEDFHHFVCGNLMKNINANKVDVISVHKTNALKAREQIRRIVEKPIELGDPKHLIAVKFFYRACMNETAIEAEGLKRLKGILRDLGGWPLLDGNKWREENFDWKNSVHKLRKIGYNFDLFLPITVDLDVISGNKFVVYVNTPDVKQQREKLKSNYFNYMMEMAVLLGLPQTYTYHAKNEIKDYYNFEMSILENIPEENYAIQDYKKYTITEMQKKYPSIPWYEYINGVLYPSAKISVEEEIVVKNSAYIKKIEELLINTPKRTLANFISWNVVHHFSFYLNDQAKNIYYQHEMWNSDSGVSKTKTQWENCVIVVSSRLKLPILRSYKEFNFNNKVHIQDIVNMIKIQYQNTIISTLWIDEDTIKFLLEKLMQMKIHIGAPNKLSDDHLLSDIYEPVEIHEDKYLASVLNIDFLNTNFVYEKLHRKLDDYLWMEQVLPFNLYVKYMPDKNTLIVNSDFMENGLYLPNTQHYVNYGVLGSIIANEMGKFMTDGVFFSNDGQFQKWRGVAYYEKHITKDACLRPYYEGHDNQAYFHIKIPKYPVISDYYGKRTLYDAYITWTNLNKIEEEFLTGLNYSPREMIWIINAFQNCGNTENELNEKDLVNGPLKNINEFAETFFCKIDSPMNINNKCGL